MTSEQRICRVLIVDDDVDLCDLLSLILEKNGQVHVEHTLKDAESHVRDIDPLIVFLDNNLPDGLGLQHIRSIRELCPNVHIVLMTAESTPDLRENALREGAVQFVPKPFTSATINKIIVSICAPDRAA